MPSIEDLLLDSKSGWFRWADRKDGVIIYQTGLGADRISTVVNGYGVPATWQQEYGLSKFQTFFKVLGRLSPSWNAYFVAHIDDAFGAVLWEKSIAPANIPESWLSNALEKEGNYVQAGESFIGLYLDNPEDLILFTYYDGGLKLSLFGEMRDKIPAALGLNEKAG